MKIFISIDAEGCSGLTRMAQVTPGSEEYPQCIEAMYNDLKCVMRGAIQGGATEFVICDAHENGTNLTVMDDRFFDLPSVNIAFVRGTGGQLSMMQGIDATFDGAFFIGYHAKRGTMGIMAHTYFPNCIYDAKVNGASVGELGLNIPVAQMFGVPALLATGDYAFCAEAIRDYGSIEVVAVKKAFSNACALCYDQDEVNKNLQEVTKRAMQRCGNKSSLKKAENYVIELAFMSAGQAERAAMMEGVTRKGDDRIAIENKDYIRVFKSALAAMELANGYVGF